MTNLDETRPAECRSCGHWKRHHDEHGCNVVAGTVDGLGDAPCPCARFQPLPAPHPDGGTEALRAAVAALHRPWYEVNGVRHDHRVIADPDDVPYGHECVATGFDRCDPDDETHYVLACYECRGVTSEDVTGYALWPCATAALLAAAPAPTEPVQPRLDCLARWPDAWSGTYDPRCCRFPKSCSPNLPAPAPTEGI